MSQVPGGLVISVQIGGVGILYSWQSPCYGGLELLDLRVHLIDLFLQLLDEAVLLLQRVLGLDQLVSGLCQLPVHHYLCRWSVVEDTTYSSLSILYVELYKC